MLSKIVFVKSVKDYFCYALNAHAPLEWIEWHTRTNFTEPWILTRRISSSKVGHSTSSSWASLLTVIVILSSQNISLSTLYQVVVASLLEAQWTHVASALKNMNLEYYFTLYILFLSDFICVELPSCFLEPLLVSITTINALCHIDIWKVDQLLDT